MNRLLAGFGLAASLGLGGMFVACGNTTGGAADMAMGLTPTGTPQGYAVNSLVLPMTKVDFAMDLNGDGKKDNQLGNIISTLKTQNLDAQSGVDGSIATGSVSILMSVQASDPTLVASVPAGVTFYIGKAGTGMQAAGDGGACTGCPDFGGMGMFAIDASQMSKTFIATASGGHFNSEDPITTTNPITITLKVALVPGGDPINLVVNGAHMQFDVVSTAGKLTLEKGQINGSIKNADVQQSIIPAVAALLTARLKADPNSATSMTIAGLFDTGGCSDGAVPAKAKDGIITGCEVAQNGIIMAVLAPDVQIYDATDPTKYAPNAKNTTHDSLSLGLGFHAVTGTIK